MVPLSLTSCLTCWHACVPRVLLAVKVSCAPLCNLLPQAGVASNCPHTVCRVRHYYSDSCMKHTFTCCKEERLFRVLTSLTIWASSVWSGGKARLWSASPNRTVLKYSKMYSNNCATTTGLELKGYRPSQPQSLRTL